MFMGEKLTFQMFNHHQELKGEDMQEGGDFLEAPILCSANRERHTINGAIAPIRASAKGLCVIPWNANLEPFWDQKPLDQCIPNIMHSDPCFWEHFARGTDGHLTHNPCKQLKLVNGTHIRCHSLSPSTLVTKRSNFRSSTLMPKQEKFCHPPPVCGRKR
jgi:hypothetical protein